jgi:DedD protein
MESKTKHRILGVVVVAGLAVLAYPLIQGSYITPGAQAMVKAPPFPDQAIQVSSADTSDAMQSDSALPPATTPEAPSATPTPDSSASALPAQTPKPDAQASTTPELPKADQQTKNQDTSGVVNVAAPTEGSASAPAAGTSDTVEITPEIASQADKSQAPAAVEHELIPPPSSENKMTDAPVTNQEIETPQKSPKKKRTSKVGRMAKNKQPVIYSKVANHGAKLAYKQMPLDKNGLMQLKKSAWVIQMGSFKQKTNALKLVNKLRSKGYRAFIQNVNGDTGENTRVFVGPEHQQASARIVATELATNMKLQGIVISYKPFTL